MKTGLAHDEDDVIATRTFTDLIGEFAAACKSFLVRRPRPCKSEAWLSGYNAFYDGIKANPHAPGTDAHLDWEMGSKAFDEDFEW